MSYSSIIFLYFFLPVFFCLYALTKPAHRAFVLCLGSCTAVLLASPWGLLPMLLSVTAAYVCANGAHKKSKEKKGGAKALIAVAVIINVLIFLCLAGEGYHSVRILEMLWGKLKLFSCFGVCVYTLHSISYCVDVYRGEIEPERNFIRVFAYISFMPILTCGPVLKYSQVSEKLREVKLQTSLLSDGILLYLCGLAEKVILADSLASIHSDICSVGFDNISAVTAWLAAIIFGLRFYFGLQGLSHMARGIAMMLGFEIRKNFDLPMMRYSVGSFIASFNTSLSDWGKSYIFKPLGGRKNQSVVLTFKNLLITAVLTGLWYGFGFGFALWAVYIAVISGMEMLLSGILEKLPRAIRVGFTHFLLTIGWGLLSGADLTESFDWIRSMFSAGFVDDGSLSIYFMKSSASLVLICLVCATPLFRTVEKRLDKEKINVLTAAKPAMILALMILCTAFMLSGDGSGYGF